MGHHSKFDCPTLSDVRRLSWNLSMEVERQSLVLAKMPARGDMMRAQHFVVRTRRVLSTSC